MTTLLRPGKLLTIADYAALPEDDRRRWEFQEGSLLMSPGQPPRHMVAVAQLYGVIEGQLPVGLRAVPNVDLDLQLAPPDQPGTSRRPDLIVVSEAEFHRVENEGGLLRASAALLVTEILSPGSRRTDNLVKRGEYADAGIPYYWIIDAEAPVSLVACHFAGTFGYQDSGEITGVFESAEPFGVRIDLDALC
ncbi:Uma2 family endonuclease [Jatrophihabitans sp.]|uniref:Uma2 family endonuclease n=1 Tax=Jatrophihabitans sp. TaxID=1932789 RepID=UPI002B5AF6E1|nr:Uma2 family endonuclease [Jatrophihabitans sp.]